MNATAQAAALVETLRQDSANNVALILKEKAAYLRTKKAAHYHEYADALDAAAVNV